MMTTQKKTNTDFPLFDELAPLIPEECHEEVRRTMNLVENVWRDDLCKATIRYVKKGKRKAYKKSRVMQRLFGKIIKTLYSSPLLRQGSALVPGESSNSNNR